MVRFEDFKKDGKKKRGEFPGRRGTSKISKQCLCACARSLSLTKFSFNHKGTVNIVVHFDAIFVC